MEEDNDEGYPSPEDAALADWPPEAMARVLRARIRKGRATVLVDTVPSHPMSVVCEKRVDGLWETVSDSNA